MAQQQARDEYNRESESSPLGSIKYHHWYQRVTANTDTQDQETDTDPLLHRPLRLVDLLHDVRNAKFAILSGALIGLACAFLFCTMAIPHYRATMILAPAKPMSGNANTTLENPDSFSALSIFMQYTGFGNSSEFQRFEATARRQSVAEKLLQDQNILNGLSVDRAFPFAAQKQNWNAGELSEYLQNRISFENTGTGGMRRISYSHPTPDFARYLLSQIHTITDSMIRESIRQKTTDRITYLQKNLSQTSHPDHRRALTSLLLEQERMRMLVSIDQPYAATIIEAPAHTPQATWPDRLLVYTALITVFAFTGFAIHEYRKAHAR